MEQSTEETNPFLPDKTMLGIQELKPLTTQQSAPLPARASISQDTSRTAIYCTQCGTRLPGDAVFCLRCGKQLKDREVQEQFTKDQNNRSMSQANPANSNELQRREESRNYTLVMVLSLVALVLMVGGLFLYTNPSVISNTFNQQSQTSNQSTSQPSGLSSDAATQVFTDMGNALKNKDYTTLYNMTSSDYQAHRSQSEMIQYIKYGFDSNLVPVGIPPTGAFSSGTITLTDVAFGSVSMQTRTSPYNMTLASARVDWTFSNGTSFSGTTILISENDSWKIQELGM